MTKLHGQFEDMAPCPFCGDDGPIVEDVDLDTYTSVECMECDAGGPAGCGTAEAIRLWNQAPRRQEAVKLEKAAQEFTRRSDTEIDGVPS